MQAAHVESAAKPKRPAVLRHWQCPQHANVPDQQLQQQRDVADGLDVGECEPRHQPVRRQTREPDDKAEHRRDDDAERGHDQRVDQADPERARVCAFARVVDQRLRDVEAGRAAEESETGRDVLLAQVLRRVGHDLIAENEKRDEQQALKDPRSHLGIVEVGRPRAEIGRQSWQLQSHGKPSTGSAART